MGNHKLEHYRSQVNTIPPIMSKVVIVETQKQNVRIGITQSFNAVITTIGMEVVFTPNINVVRKGVLIIFVAKLGTRSNGVLVGRNLNQSSMLPTAIITVIGIPQMVFTNLIMVIHGNMTTD